MIRRGVQIVLAVFFLVAGVLHFHMDDAFARIVPPVLPFPVALVWVTGAMEFAFAATLIAK
jgi:uncharacterized membrane protein